MARRRHPFAPFVGGTLKSIPELPEAATLRELGLPFTEAEFNLISTAMALYKASRQPQLTRGPVNQPRRRPASFKLEF